MLENWIEFNFFVWVTTFLKAIYQNIGLGLSTETRDQICKKTQIAKIYMMKNFIIMKVLKLWKTFRASKASRTRKDVHATHQCELASRAGAGDLSNPNSLKLNKISIVWHYYKNPFFCTLVSVLKPSPKDIIEQIIANKLGAICQVYKCKYFWLIEPRISEAFAAYRSLGFGPENVIKVIQHGF